MLNPENSEYVLKCLNVLMNSCVKNETEALTAPIQKISHANIKFTGHTEFLAKQIGHIKPSYDAIHFMSSISNNAYTQIK